MTATAVTTATAGAGAGITSAEPLDPDAGRFHREAARTRAGELFAEHATLIHRICSRLLRDDFEAEDAAQQTFLSAYKALLGGAEPRDVEAWLATIARNECLQRIRTRMRLPLPVLEHDVEDGRPDVHHLALDRVNAAKLWREISRLPPQQRDAVILREVAGLSYDELALLLGVTRPGVESLLFRARGRLRSRLRTALASVNLAGLASEVAAAIARFAGQGAAPLAAKAAAVGVGVAVVGGGGLVAEQRLEPREPVQMPAVAAAAPGRHTTRPLTTHAAPVAPRPTPPAPLVVATTEEKHGDHGLGKRDDHVRGDDGDRKREGRDRGETPSVVVETVPHLDAPTTAPVPVPIAVPAPATTSSSGDGPSGSGDVRVTTLASTDGHDGDGSSSMSATTTATTGTTVATTTTSGGDGHDGGSSTTTGTTTDGHDGGSGSDGGTSGRD